jgi:hypothetical protein
MLTPLSLDCSSSLLLAEEQMSHRPIGAKISYAFPLRRFTNKNGNLVKTRPTHLPGKISGRSRTVFKRTEHQVSADRSFPVLYASLPHGSAAEGEAD